jgi:hypothetical protein
MAQPSQLPASEVSQAPQAVSADDDKIADELDVPFLTEEDKEAAIKLLKNRRMIENLLGPNRKFIYDPTKLMRPFRDPMVIPWSRGNDLKKTLDGIQQRIDAGPHNHGAAKEDLVNIKNNFNVQQHAQRIDDMISYIDTYVHDPDSTPTPTPTPVFPVAVLNSTRAILYSVDDPLVLIDDDTLTIGEAVPGYRNIVIKRIEPNRVVFDFNGVEYEKIIDALDQE